MKKILLLIITFVLAININAQSPESFKYQSIVRDGSGNALINQSVGIQIRILKSSSTGTEVYNETHSVTTNAFGLVNLAIGTGTVVNGVFADVSWAFDNYFIEVSIDPTGGTSYSITGTSQLLSVPYALHAKSAQWNNASNGNGIQYFPADFSNIAINDNPSIFSKLLVSINQPSTSILGNIRAINYDSNGSTSVMVSNNNANNFEMGINGSTSPFGTNEAYLWYYSDFDLKMATGSIERLRIKNSAEGGRVEVKTGDVYIENIGSGVILRSPDAACWRMTVSNAGAQVITSIPCP
jgi:hypothetical protein